MDLSIEDILSALFAAIAICISIMARTGRKKARTEKEQPAPNNPWDVLSQRINEPTEEQQIHIDSAEKIFDEISYKPQSKRKKISQKRAVKHNSKTTENATNQTLSKEAATKDIVAQKSNDTFKFKLRDAVIYSEVMTPKFRNEE